MEGEVLQFSLKGLQAKAILVAQLTASKHCAKFCRFYSNFVNLNQGSVKPRFFKKSPTHWVFGILLDFGLYWVFQFFIWTSSWEACWLFSSSAKLLFRFTSTLDYLKIGKFITYWSLAAVDIKKSLIFTGVTNWNWTWCGWNWIWCRFFAVFFQLFLPK